MTNSIHQYCEPLPPDRRERICAIHDLIVGLYPDVVFDMRYKMATYHVGEGWVALANQNDYLSIYTCGAHHLATFKAKHQGIKTGKGCIRFRPRDRIPVASLKQVITHAMDHPKRTA